MVPRRNHIAVRVIRITYICMPNNNCSAPIKRFIINPEIKKILSLKCNDTFIYRYNL